MSTDRREFVKSVSAAAVTAAASTSVASAVLSGQQAGRITALAFDAYGTLFDVFSVTALCESLFPGKGSAVAQLWRVKQLQYSLLRSLMERHRDFWAVTEEALVYTARSLSLDLTPERRSRLMDAYLSLAAFPDVKPGLEALRTRGVRLAILSNGAPTMLEAAARSAGIFPLLDAILSVEEVKIYKPSPRVYGMIGERFAARTDQVGFVSSNSWDINGAGSTGLTTFWIQRSAAEPQEEVGFPASHIVRALTELPDLVGA